MKNLFGTDFVILDSNERMITFSNSKEIMIFGNKQEAEENCNNNQKICSCSLLSQDNTRKLINQIFGNS